MISTDKITKIFCLIDDFCIELDQVIDKNSIDDGSGIKKAQQGLQNVTERSDHHYGAFPSKAIPLPKAFLPQLCVRTYAGGFSADRVLYPFCRVTAKGRDPYGALSANVLFGPMFGDLLYGFDFDKGMPYQKGKTEQGLQGNSGKGQRRYGMVLWVRAPYYHQ